jgi:general stress protein 26
MTDAARQKLWQLIQKHRFAMLTTHADGDVLRSRPMTTIERNFDGSLWFFARTDSQTAAAIARRAQVCLGYATDEPPRGMGEHRSLELGMPH